MAGISISQFLLPLAVLAVASSTVSAQDAALSVSGFGVHQSSSSSASSAPLQDVSAVAARLLGLDVPLDRSISFAGDLFARPTACVVLAIENVGLGDLSGAADLPNLRSSFAEASAVALEQPRKWSLAADAADVKLAHALSYGRARFANILRAQFPDSLVVTAGSDEAMMSAVGPAEAFYGAGEEVETFLQAAEMLDSAKAVDEAPDFVVLPVGQFKEENGEAERIKKLEAFDKRVPEVVKAFQDKFGQRAAVQIVLLGKSMPACDHGRLLLESNSSSSNSTSSELTYTTNQIADYLLMSWTSVVLFLFLLMFFLCVPWSDELDPILYSGLQQDDAKKEM
mmetsp:Transcript_15111/g.24348  ORF Transcript_15111/g.24348 Transcript_15111/m.24348 type:complete len:340 (+) Transcript_15111:163-1182(+)